MLETPDLVARKKALRKRMRDPSSAPWGAQPEARGRADAIIAELLPATELWSEAEALVLFAAVRHEVSTRALVEPARAQGKRLYLPRIRGAVGEGRMTMHRVEADDELVPGPYGLFEPREDLPADLPSFAGLAAVIIPGLAFTEGGLRLGQGGGFYDRFLAGLPEHAGERVVAGLAYQWQVLDELPVCDHDQRVDFLCTEAGFRACSPDT